MLLVIFISLLPSTTAQTQLSDCQNTSQVICNGNFPKDTANRTLYECTTNQFSSVNLNSCDNGDPGMTIFWFWYDDVCRYNTILNVPFATVSTTGESTCRNRSTLNITYDMCHNEYIFTRGNMMIRNITTLTPQKYICFLSNTQAVMNYTSTRIYSITVLGMIL